MNLYVTSRQVHVTRCIQCEIMGPRWFNVYTQVHQIIWSGFFMKSGRSSCFVTAALIVELVSMNLKCLAAIEARRIIVPRKHDKRAGEWWPTSCHYQNWPRMHQRINVHCFIIECKTFDNRCDCIKTMLAFTNWNQWCVLIWVEQNNKMMQGASPH